MICGKSMIRNFLTDILNFDLKMKLCHVGEHCRMRYHQQRFCHTSSTTQICKTTDTTVETFSKMHCMTFVSNYRIRVDFLFPKLTEVVAQCPSSDIWLQMLFDTFRPPLLILGFISTTNVSHCLLLTHAQMYKYSKY